MSQVGDDTGALVELKRRAQIYAESGLDSETVETVARLMAPERLLEQVMPGMQRLELRYYCATKTGSYVSRVVLEAIPEQPVLRALMRNAHIDLSENFSNDLRYGFGVSYQHLNDLIAITAVKMTKTKTPECVDSPMLTIGVVVNKGGEEAMAKAIPLVDGVMQRLVENAQTKGFKVKG
jgi:hypothetical protein